ncbi:MAG: putative cell division protein FtsQ, partial [Chloroflexi bacterium]|nr:putative cell division protein FtsQ [Chloroflexota bacterium]
SSLPSDFGPVVEASAPPPALYVEEPQADLQDITASTPQVAERTTPTSAQPFMTPEFVTAVLTLAEQAPPDVPLLYDGARGFGWRDPGGWDVYFGDAQEMPMKLLVYQEIIARLDDKEETLPSLVSVEYVHAPYYRLR